MMQTQEGLFAAELNATAERIRTNGIAEAREELSHWMIEHGFAAGHGDTIGDLLKELTWQIEELRKRANAHLPNVAV